MPRAFGKYVTPSLVSLLILLLLLVSILLNSMVVPKIYDFRMSNIDGAPTPPTAVNLPYAGRAQADLANFQFEGKIDYLPFQPSKFRLKADNCVRAIAVNDVDVPIANATGAPCDFVNGIIIDLRPYLKIGVNKVVVKTWDDQIGGMTFDMEVAL